MLVSIAIGLIACHHARTKTAPEINSINTIASQPLSKAHAHNDNEQVPPLWTALRCGFASIEVDVCLVGEQLLVGHAAKHTEPEGTLQALYLEPLRNLVKKNGGRVYHHPARFTLILDVKTEAKKTHPVLCAVLKEYEDILTTFEDDRENIKAVRVIVSGNRSRTLMQLEEKRYAAYDGRLEDLNVPDSKFFMPLLSANWSREFSWQGKGEISKAALEKLKNIVTMAHARGRGVRFWNTPEKNLSTRVALWRVLLENGVDLIGTDDLEGLKKFLLENEKNLRPSDAFSW